MQVASKRANLYNPIFGFGIDIVLFRAIFCFNLEIIVGAVVVKDF